MIQTISRKGNFDSAHRIVKHPGKCANLHGHTYLYELEFSFDPSSNNKGEEIGYAIDFGDIKAVAAKYLDDVYDHATIYNPSDGYISNFLDMWTFMRKVPMYLNGAGKFCNPSVENIAAQIFIELSMLCNNNSISLKSVKLHETPNCWTTATIDSIPFPLDVITKKWDNFEIPKHFKQWTLNQQ